MKPFRLAIFGALLVFSSLHLAAAALYWDADGTTAGNNTATGAGLGGTGNWDQISPLWFDGTNDVAWADTNNADAVLSGTAGTVTLTDNISAANLYFTNVTGNYLVTNATGVEVLTVGGATPGAIDTGGGEHTIAAPIANSSTLNKNGLGRLHLPVDNGASFTGTMAVNQGDVSVENNNAIGVNTSATVADGAALVLNGGTNGLTAFYPNVTINGTGITNSGALRNLSGVTTFYGQIVLGENNSVIYVDSGAALVYDGENGALTDNGNNYNLIVSANGTGNMHLGATSIGGTLLIEGPASVYSYLTGLSPVAWASTYISAGGTLYAENNNSFGTQPATLMTTNCLVDGGTISSAGTYTMYATGGITVTTNGGTLNCTSGTWTSCNIYSSNANVTLGGSGSHRPGGAAGTTTGAINLGTGAIIKNGSGDCNMTYANPSLEIYSNLVLNGGSFSFNYDSTSGQVSSLGAVPNTLNGTNILLNGGALHVGHSTTIVANRGIYLASGTQTIEDTTSGGTATIAGPITGPGSLNCPLGKSGSTTAVTLTANNSYTGTTTVGASCTVNVGSGGSTGTLGTGNTSVSGTLTFNRTGSYSYGGVISGAGVVNKTGSGTVTFTGANTYTGATTISGGTLAINNTSGSGTGTGSVAVNSGGTLTGTGTISGPVTTASGSTLALGLTTLTMGSTLSLGGSVTVSLNKSLSPSNGMAVVSGAITRTGTGTITVTNLGPSLAAGDTFQLFSQPVSGGGAMTISGGGTNVVWTNNLAVNGTISVVSATPPIPSAPGITQVQLVNGNITISGTNGTDTGTFYVLSTTNLTLPLSQWTTNSTNSFNGSQFSVTNAITPGLPQQFYILQVP